jgi:hypothetical protein
MAADVSEPFYGFQPVSKRGVFRSEYTDAAVKIEMGIPPHFTLSPSRDSEMIHYQLNGLAKMSHTPSEIRPEKIERIPNLQSHVMGAFLGNYQQVQWRAEHCRLERYHLVAVLAFFAACAIARNGDNIFAIVIAATK